MAGYPNGTVRAPMPILPAALFFVALSACEPVAGEAVGPASEVVSLEIAPATARLDTSPDAAATVQFTATATFEDGTSAEIDLVSWSLSNFAAGEIDDAGLFTASTENGAISTVVVEHAGIQATAELTVVYSDTLDQTGGTAQPADFDGTAAAEIGWIYPEQGVAVPRNIPSLTLMWDAVPGATAYRTEFTTPITNVFALTTEPQITLDADSWGVIAATNAGGTVEVEVRAQGSSGLAVSASRSVNVNRLDALGSIYYWSTTDGGVMRVPVDAEEPELFYGPQTGAPHCVACHTVRQDRMSVSYGISNTTDFLSGVVDISGDTPAELTSVDRAGFYNTLSPDANLMLTSSDTGALDLWDAETGVWLNKQQFADFTLTQPDWSPNGSQIVAVDAEELFGECCFQRGQLVLLPVDETGSLGEPTVLYAPVDEREDTINVFYPTFSPDGRWIAFNMGLGNSYDNENAQLYVISVDGGNPIALAAANFGEGLTNSWPRWGPLPDDDVFWLTFASKRPYGNLITDGRSQVWIAAFRPEDAEAGVDPSQPAFWLPNQDPATSNHTSFWGP